MPYSLIFAPEAEEQLLGLYHHLADLASPEIALEYTNAVIVHCEEMKTFPHRGNKRDDIRAGLRITHYKKKTIIAFAVFDEIISILGIYHGGQNYEAILTESNDDTQ
ncbi:type II toxin-antitoxin system RelE/ParE family toxin [Desulfovibrio caledoniensis]